MRQRRIVLELPTWVESVVEREDSPRDSVEDRMRFVIELARGNVEHRTGGPFGAVVFETVSGRIAGVGVNVVETSHCSIAHAEMIAISMAQRAMGHHDLGNGTVAYEVVTSSEPCAMCLGAIPWSGVRRVVCGARGEDVCAIGFDEGAKPTDWLGELRKRGIEVVQDVLRLEALGVLRQYAETGGIIYSARAGA